MLLNWDLSNYFVVYSIIMSDGIDGQKYENKTKIIIKLDSPLMVCKWTIPPLSEHDMSKLYEVSEGSCQMVIVMFSYLSSGDHRCLQDQPC